MYYSELPSLEVAQKRLEEHENRMATLRDLLTGGEYELKRLRENVRMCVSKEFQDKYGEYDCEVRQKYINLVESLAYKKTLEKLDYGYAFELYNFSGGILERHVFFVPEENIEKCKLDQLTVNAFLVLKKIPETNGFGFGIDEKIRCWGSIAPICPGIFDYEGYKCHLK